METISRADFENAVLVFAHYLGIDIDNEPELIEVARNALMHLPPNYELGVGEEEDNKGIPYFFNLETQDSVWTHPAEKAVLRAVREEKKRIIAAQT